MRLIDGITPTEAAMTREERTAASAADRMWRWKVDRPTPEVLALTISNLIAAGFERREPRGYGATACPWEWVRPGGGYVFPVHVDDDGTEYLTHHAIEAYGHDLPPCPKCGTIVNRGYYDSATGWCGTCMFWREKIGHPFLIVEREDGSGRSCYSDSGDRPGKDGSSHLGFGGHRWHLEALDGTRSWSTNNLYGQGSVPECFYDDFPATHRIVRPS